MICPACDAVIYSRRSGLCGVCGARLPETMLFNPEQREKLEDQMERMKAERRAVMAGQAHLMTKDIDRIFD
jgi:predicted amidophosphoribosyltransferase